MNRLHIWGCPGYVLDPQLQNGKQIPKWTRRSRQGQFMGFSPHHSTKVALMLNIATGNISPQYHVVFDDHYDTVDSTFADPNLALDQVFNGNEWSRLVSSGLERYLPDDATPPPLDPQWDDEDDPALAAPRAANRRALRDQHQHNPGLLPPTLAPPPHPPERAPVTSPERAPAPTSEIAPLPPPKRAPGPPSTHPTSDLSDYAPFLADDTLDVSIRDLPVIEQNRERIRADEEGGNTDNSSGARRSKRRLQRNKRIWDGQHEVNLSQFDRNKISQFDILNKCKLRIGTLNNAFLSGVNWDNKGVTAEARDWKNFHIYIARTLDAHSDTWESPHPMLLTAKSTSDDNPNWHQAVNGPFSDQFHEAMEIEIATLEKLGAWVKVKRTHAMNVIKSTWAFKIKRYPNGLLRKLKARFCVRGDMQIEGVDYFDTFAPVVQWTIIRTLLVLSVKLKLCTAQVDYTAAFPQAGLEDEVYVEMPRGFKDPGYVYKLKKSLYGLRQSPRNFFEHLKDQLTKVGFEQSSADSCLFIKDDCICITYVDDILIFARSNEIINKMIKDLRSEGAQLEKEEDVAGFLGVKIDRNDELGTITMTQTGLIDRIITAMGLDDANCKETPATCSTLPKDKDGEECNEDFNYASVLGMLLYLQGHTRPDISFAVNQCARYAFGPRRSHEEAMKHIGPYLKGTRDKGTIMTPSENLQLDCYVDADFAGLWNYEEDMDPTSVKSRSGFLFMLGGCPISWVSRLQSEIALSTMESEYVAMSVAMKDLIPLQRIVKTVIEAVGLDPEIQSTLKSEVWEDNAGALILAKLEPPRMTLRSKHYALKYHWFRYKVKELSIGLNKIGTKEQLADILTKGLPKVDFQRLRLMLMGW